MLVVGEAFVSEEKKQVYGGPVAETLDKPEWLGNLDRHIAEKSLASQSLLSGLDFKILFTPLFPEIREVSIQVLTSVLFYGKVISK